jgi:hypothetical protein
LRDHHAAQCSAKSGDPFKFANEKTGDNGEGGDATELRPKRELD